MHSTSKGIGRELGGSYGSATYCKEELVAQIASSMALNIFGIVPDKEEEFDNDIAYIKGWADYLKENKKEILIASSQAEKAVKYFCDVAERQLEIEKNAMTFIERGNDYENCDR